MDLQWISTFKQSDRDISRCVNSKAGLRATSQARSIGGDCLLALFFAAYTFIKFTYEKRKWHGSPPLHFMKVKIRNSN